jgi:hypothetical protein
MEVLSAWPQVMLQFCSTDLCDGALVIMPIIAGRNGANVQLGNHSVGARLETLSSGLPLARILARPLQPLSMSAYVGMIQNVTACSMEEQTDVEPMLSSKWYWPYVLTPRLIPRWAKSAVQSQVEIFAAHNRFANDGPYTKRGSLWLQSQLLHFVVQPDQLLQRAVRQTQQQVKFPAQPPLHDGEARHTKIVAVVVDGSKGQTSARAELACYM